MAHHKRGKPKSMRAGCCCRGKGNKQEWATRKIKIRRYWVARKITDPELEA